MTIASELTKLNTNLTNSYTAVSGKGGTLPSAQNFDNLATAISSIPSGGGGYSELPNYQVENGVASKITKALTGNEFSDITSIGTDGLKYAFMYCSGLSGKLDLSSLTTVGSTGMHNAFAYCSAITSVDLSSLINIGNHGCWYAFNYCTGLKEVDFSLLPSVGSHGLNSAIAESRLTSISFPSLTSVETYGLASAFLNCRSLTSVDLSSLTTVGSYGLSSAFAYCSAITSVDLSSLTTVGSSGLNSAFKQCTQLQHVYFNALTSASFGTYVNQFQNMMSSTGNKKVHRLHFPSNLESTISGLTGYPLFGGTSGYVILSYDLPATS